GESWTGSNRLSSHSCRSIGDAPSTSSSASALATPAECVTQTASASQNPSRGGASPISGKPSGVKEKTPLMPSPYLVSASGGSSSQASRQAGSKSSSVKVWTDGIVVAFRAISCWATGIGLCAYEPTPIRSPWWRKRSEEHTSELQSR